jgi:hypothetical protein
VLSEVIDTAQALTEKIVIASFQPPGVCPALSTPIAPKCARFSSTCFRTLAISQKTACSRSKRAGSAERMSAGFASSSPTRVSECPGAQLDHLFEAFSQGDAYVLPGRGYRPWIGAHAPVVQPHGGVISATGESGRGSIFTVEIPARIERNLAS